MIILGITEAYCGSERTLGIKTVMNTEVRNIALFLEVLFSFSYSAYQFIVTPHCDSKGGGTLLARGITCVTDFII